MGAFQVLVLNRSAIESWDKFIGLPEFLPFRDASISISSYDCTILTCLKSLEKAYKLNWFTIKTFDYEFYDLYGNRGAENMTWIIPHKLLAFSCPVNEERIHGKSYNPETYAKIFIKLGIKTVVQLNNTRYEKSKFKNHGIKHYELFFSDGTCPSNYIVERFFSIVDIENGGVAVHCKAGLGRTGTLIGTYAIRKYHFPADDFIAWCRICRPGSIHGPQPQFLLDFERKILSTEKIRRKSECFLLESDNKEYQNSHENNKLNSSYKNNQIFIQKKNH